MIVILPSRFKIAESDLENLTRVKFRMENLTLEHSSLKKISHSFFHIEKTVFINQFQYVLQIFVKNCLL